MLKLFRIGLYFAIGIVNANAAQTMSPLVFSQAAVVSGYTGIGDLSVPGTPYWYIGGDCYHGSGTFNIAVVYDTTGAADTATVQCVNGVISTTGGSTWTWATVQANCLATRCLVHRFYDQSVSGRCTSASCDFWGDFGSTPSTTNSPYFVYANGTTCGAQTAGGFCANFTATTQELFIINAYSAAAQPINVACVGTTTGQDDVYSDNGAGLAIGDNASNEGDAYAGSTIATANSVSFGTMRALFATFDNAGSPRTQLNQGTPVATTQGTNTSGTNFGAINYANAQIQTVTACFMTTGTDFGATAIANIYSTWKTHFGGLP